MGCAFSCDGESPVLGHLRERRDLIGATADNRFALSSAHSAYFLALSSVGDALLRFAHDELSADPGSSSPLLSVPSIEAKLKRAPTTAAAAADSSSAVTPLSHSLSIDSHLHLSSDADPETVVSGSKESLGIPVSSTLSRSPASPSPPLRPPSPTPSPRYHYMKSSTAIPSMVYSDSLPNSYTTAYGYESGYGYGYNYAAYGIPIGSQEQHQPSRTFPSAEVDPSSSSIQSPPLPPEEEVSAWDFLNPFDSFDHGGVPQYQYVPTYGVSSGIGSPDSTELRKKEGIPDLEDDIEKAEEEPTVSNSESKTSKSKVKRKSEEDMKDIEEDTTASFMDRGATTKKKVKGSIKRCDSSEGEVLERRAKGNLKGFDPTSMAAAKNSVEEEGKKSVSFEEETSFVTEVSMASHATALSAHGTLNVFEVMRDIKEHFERAVASGDEVSRLLEVGKQRYSTRSSLLKSKSSFVISFFLFLLLHHLKLFSNKICEAILSWILDLIANLFTHPSTQRSRASRRWKMNFPSLAGPEKNFTSGNLSTTLEKLYQWESKLYKEVKEEEKLRFQYERKHKHLLALENVGAEPSKIESAREAAASIQTKRSVVNKSINVIMEMMHKIRDEELQPQVIQLVQGLSRMWKYVLYCHQRQLHAIIECKTPTLMIRNGGGVRKNFNAARDLESELLNWCSCFGEWIITQKAYIETLNGWLIRWLPQEKELTSDGVMPFSPGRIGAPPVFVVCNDWYQAMSLVSEGEVLRSMRSFASVLRDLWQSQEEEQRQKMRIEDLSRDLGSKLRSLQEDLGVSGRLDFMVAPPESAQVPRDGRIAAVQSARRRLEDERAKYEHTLLHVHEEASDSLKGGLAPVFKALGIFTSDMLKAFEGLRIAAPTSPAQQLP